MTKVNRQKAHQSVLLSEVIRYFEPCKIRVLVDGTLGAGGHAAALLAAHPEVERLIAIDQDPLALDIAGESLSPWKEKVTFICGNFENLGHYLDRLGIDKIDGVLLDLGVSSMQLDTSERGFSFLHDGPLDMRMNPVQPVTADFIVNTYSQKELERIFRDYGEEKQWRRAAAKIVQARIESPIHTTYQLVEALRPVLRPKPGKRINPCTLIFQALRIAVNRELEVVEKGVLQAIHRLNSLGRLGVISFHSLEDRIVKNLFRNAASDKQETKGLAGLFRDKEPEVILLTKKPAISTEAEIAANARGRSAKLRFIEKK